MSVITSPIRVLNIERDRVAWYVIDKLHTTEVITHT